MIDLKNIEVSPFPPCGDGLKTVKSRYSGELIAGGSFDLYALNDGKPLSKYCSFCLELSSKVACLECEMSHYCSENCRKKDSKSHEFECLLACRLKSVNQLPTRTQRLLLRLLKCSLNIEVNFDLSSIDKGISEYLMISCAVIKKYLPEVKEEVHDLFLKLCQLRCSCFDIDEIGVGFSESLKKINHSCNPNAVAEFSGNSVALIAKRDIKAGEQLTISYIENPLEDPNILSNFYHFECQCDFCSK